MEKKQYLTEETYERGKKKLKTIALIILIAGLLIGGSLIVTGIIKISDAKKSNEIVENKEPERTESVVQAEIDALNEELVPLKAQKNTEFHANGFSEEYYRLDNEISKKSDQIIKLESELFKLERGLNDDEFDKSFEIAKNVPFFIFGGFIIFASCIASGSIYLFSKRREITAFTVQQTMPLAQEGIEKMSPTVGNAVGGIAGSIAKGIKDGLKDDEE